MNNILLLREFINEYNRLLYSSYEIDGEKLYPAEIILIAAIATEPSAGVAKLSQELAVTKSAVSQKINLLCKKDYMFLESKVGRKKFFKLTPKGQAVFRLHQELSSTYTRELTELFDSLEESERLAYKKIMSRLIDLHKSKDFQRELKEAYDESIPPI